MVFFSTWYPTDGRTEQRALVVAASSFSCAAYLDGLVDVSHGICFYVGVLLCGSHQFGKRREQSFDAYPGHVFVLSRHQHCSVRPVGHHVSTASSSVSSPRCVADAQTSPHVSWHVPVVRVRGGSVVGCSCAPFPDLVSTLAASTTMVYRPPLLFPRTTSCACGDRTVHVHVDARRADGNPRCVSSQAQASDERIDTFGHSEGRSSEEHRRIHEEIAMGFQREVRGCVCWTASPGGCGRTQGVCLRSWGVSAPGGGARAATMKLDPSALRYLSKDDFRVLTAVELGQRNVRGSNVAKEKKKRTGNMEGRDEADGDA